MVEQGYKKNILVIGGTGFIGSNLVKYLTGRGSRVSVLHRRDSNLKNLEGLSFNSVIGDLTDLENLEPVLCQAIEDSQCVYNLAACGSSSARYRELRQIVNVEAAKAVASLIRRIGNRRLIHISSSAAVGFPRDAETADEDFIFNAYDDHYALTKHMGEQVVLDEVNRGLDAVIAIPCSTIGSYAIKSYQLATIQSLACGKMPIYPPGGLCLTDARDLVRGLELCSERGSRGKRYILGGDNIKYGEYFKKIALLTRGNFYSVRLPNLFMPWLGFGYEALSKFLRKEDYITKNEFIMISRDLFYSSERAKRELGYTIRGWEMTLEDTVAALGITNSRNNYGKG